MHRLAVVLLNYKTPHLTIDCLGSLAGQLDPERDCVVIVENGSNDGSTERIEAAIRDNGWAGLARVLVSEVNLGFPGGCNFGIKAVQADRIMLLNNDTLFEPGAVDEMLRVLDEQPKVGLVTPQPVGTDGKVQHACFRYRSPISEFLGAASTGPISRLLKRYEILLPPSDEPREADWLAFPCVVIRRELIEEIGMLEEGYFLYFDDVDYCRRAHNAGWRVLNLPDAKIVHLGGASNPLEEFAAARKRKPYYYYASRAWYFAKFYGRSGLFFANLLWTFGRMISFARELVGNKQPHTSEREWLDVWTNCFNPFKPPKRWEKKD
jgi:N-acetylglucosaminyl-diphospho-decaprenol L-rhamnosyltransferase